MHVIQNNPHHQIAGNDEEDIDADEATRNRRNAEMQSKNRQNGDRSQAIEGWNIGEFLVKLACHDTAIN